MGDKGYIFEYVSSCTAGTSQFSDCGPVWQFGAIGTGLILAVLLFVILVTSRRREETRLAR